MDIDNTILQNSLPLRLSPGFRCVILLIILLSFSIPSVADKKIFQLSLGGISIDFSYYQIFIFISLLWIVITKSKIVLGWIELVLILLFCIIIPYNMIAIVNTDYNLIVTNFRGVFNFGINVMCAVWTAHIIKKWLNAELFSVVFILFGVTLALSSLIEFSFLKLSPDLLEKWRSIVWGDVIEPNNLLSAGGVTLNPDGMARVGGLIGAPENLGVVIALTLPFALLSRIPILGHLGIVALYAFVAIIAGTRMLGIALAIYIILILQNYKGNAFLKLFNLLIIGFILIVIFIFGINPEAYSRFTGEALFYELAWRGERLSSFLEATRIKSLISFMGAGLGQFEKSGDYEVIALVGSGVLGGDIVVAYGLGGVGGIFLLIILWIAIWRITTKSRYISVEFYQANKLFILLLAVRSLFMPVLMLFVLMSNIVTLVSIAFLVLSGEMAKKHKVRN